MPQCWASLCLNHLPALADSSVSLCDCRANHLPAQPLFSCVTSGVFLRRGAGSPGGSVWRPKQSRERSRWVRRTQLPYSKVLSSWFVPLSPHRQIPATRGEWQSSACSVPCPRGQAGPQDLGCWGLAACFAADLAPLQVLTLGPFSVACLRRFGWWWHLRQQLLSI